MIISKNDWLNYFGNENLPNERIEILSISLFLNSYNINYDSLNDKQKEYYKKALMEQMKQIESQDKKLNEELENGIIASEKLGNWQVSYDNHPRSSKQKSINENAYNILKSYGLIKVGVCFC